MCNMRQSLETYTAIFFTVQSFIAGHPSDMKLLLLFISSDLPISHQIFHVFSINSIPSPSEKKPLYLKISHFHIYIKLINIRQNPKTSSWIFFFLDCPLEMDVIQSVPRVMSSDKKKTKSKRNINNSLKVVYISSPMKVKTSATRFRSLVQELTGRHSNVSQFMDSNVCTGFHEVNESDGNLLPKSVNDDVCAQGESPTSSDSTFLEAIGNDNIFSSQTEQQFAEIFSSFYSSELDLDVLRSQEDLRIL